MQRAIGADEIGPDIAGSCRSPRTRECVSALSPSVSLVSTLPLTLRRSVFGDGIAIGYGDRSMVRCHRNVEGQRNVGDEAVLIDRVQREGVGRSGMGRDRIGVACRRW